MSFFVAARSAFVGRSSRLLKKVLLRQGKRRIKTLRVSFGPNWELFQQSAGRVRLAMHVLVTGGAGFIGSPY